MKKKDEISDLKSCFNKAYSDEYIFVLLQRDIAAPIAVRAWIDARIKMGKNKANDAQILEAEEWLKQL